MRELIPNRPHIDHEETEEIATDWGVVAVGTAKDVLEAVDTLPCIKIIAGLASTMLDVAQKVHTNKEDCQRLSRHAEKIVVSLARAQKDQSVDDDEELRDDLEDVTSAMQEVLRFLERERGTGLAMRILKKDPTINMIKDLDKRLDEAFRIFVMRSNVSLRRSQNLMAKQLEQISDVVTHSRSITPGTPEPPLGNQTLTEGIYQIVTVGTGRAIERGHADTDDVFLVPSVQCRSRRQLWVISYSPREEKKYWIRNLFDGQSLDVLASGPSSKIGVYLLHGAPWQTWELETTGDGTYIIKTCHGGTVLDSTCAQLQSCSSVHRAARRAGAPSQEWRLNLLRPRPSPGVDSPFGLLEPLFIQNKLSKCFLTQQDDLTQRDHPNVVAQEDAAIGSAWSFLYATLPRIAGSNKTFHIVSQYYGSALDHWSGRFIHASVGIKENPHVWWEIIPCGQASVVIKNRDSGRLLCHDQAKGNRRVNTTEATEYQNPMCQWHVTNAPTKGTSPHCSIVHDTMLSLRSPWTALQATSYVPSLVLPPRTATGSRSHLAESPRHPRRQTELDAAAEKESELYDKVKGADYDTFVVCPQEVDAGNKEKWERVRLLDIGEMVGKVYSSARCK